MSSPKLKIAIVGLGYIGLPTAAVLASVGHEVVGIEVSQSIVDVVNRGEVHIVEPDLDGLVHAAVHSGRLRAVLTAEPADAFMIAVPTPFMNDHQPDLRRSGPPRSSPDGWPRSDPTCASRPPTAARPTSMSPTARNAYCPAASFRNWSGTTA
jgi:hypothetical protein